MVSVPLSQIGPDEAALAQPVYGPNGSPLLQAGVVITRAYLAELDHRGVTAVWICDADTDDVVGPDALSPTLRADLTAHLGASFANIEAGSDGLRDSYASVVRQEIGASCFAERVRSVIGDAGLSHIGGDVDRMLDELKGRHVFAGLNSLKSHDAYTYQHSIDVTVMGLVLAGTLGWPRWRLRAFGIGCLLHDIGKLFVKSAILNKTSGLSPAEYDNVRQHPVLGYAVVKALTGSAGVLAAHVAYQHHERQDGGGYPRRLRGTNVLGRNDENTIHDFGAIAAVADVYDAMTSDRPYRAGWSPARTLAMINEGAGTQFNRQAVEIMRQTVAPYPVLSNVVVTSGQYSGWRGVVVAASKPDLSRPRVRLLRRADGKRISPMEIDLRHVMDAAIEADDGQALANRVA